MILLSHPKDIYLLGREQDFLTATQLLRQLREKSSDA